MKLVIGSRGSMLALWQANWVKSQLENAGHSVEIRVIKTSGDKLVDVSLAQSGTKGLFIKEIEEALLAKEVDLAVHSLKDLPTEQPEGLTIAAVPEREDPRDIFISPSGAKLNALPQGARIATSSLRRQAQIHRLRKDITFVAMRGNIDTRLNKLSRGDADALILAAAGVRRLGFQDRITSYFTRDEVCPAAGQGALAIETREDARAVNEVVKSLDHSPTHQAVLAERAALKGLGGGCQLPIAAHAEVKEGKLDLLAVVASPDGSKVLRGSLSGELNQPEALGAEVARRLIGQGAAEIIATVK